MYLTVGNNWQVIMYCSALTVSLSAGRNVVGNSGKQQFVYYMPRGHKLASEWTYCLLE